jgi:3D (Asp-Asp-Asp) domain-containing protein
MEAAVRNHRLWLVLTAVGLTLAFGACAERQSTSPPLEVASVPKPAAMKTRKFEATAYTIEGTTASGAQTRRGIVAADPKVLPLGSRIRVSDAGSYSGDYEVTDTGREIKGHEIDIYIENGAEAKRFGRRSVEVEVLQLGAR